MVHPELIFVVQVTDSGLAASSPGLRIIHCNSIRKKNVLLEMNSALYGAAPKMRN